MDFTWEPDDEGDARAGRGWAQLVRDGSLQGHFYFHTGDDSGFLAVRDAGEPSRRLSVPSSYARGRQCGYNGWGPSGDIAKGAAYGGRGAGAQKPPEPLLGSRA